MPSLLARMPPDPRAGPVTPHHPDRVSLQIPGSPSPTECRQTPEPGKLGGGLAVRQLPPRPREVTGVAVRVVLEIVLMLGLGLPEGHGLADQSHHLARPQA